MRFPLLLRVLVLMLVVAITWFVTSTLVQRTSVAQDSQPPTPKVVSADDGDGVDAVRARVPVSRVIKNAQLAGSTSKIHEIRVENGVVEIDASVEIFDKRKLPFEYLWRVRVYADPSPMGVRNFEKLTLLHDYPYVTQKFRMPESGKMEPSFRETLNLQPGRYTIFVALYELPPEFDHERFAGDEHLARSMQLMSHGQQVEIRE